MATLNMGSSYPLNNETIDRVITKTSAGNYALGYYENDTFYVFYVGRSDDDLNRRLKDWVGEYTEFKFSYAASPKEAYVKECRNYHDFGGSQSLQNRIHPDSPNGTNYRCPLCGE